jgi:hypothetical protein
MLLISRCEDSWNLKENLVLSLSLWSSHFSEGQVHFHTSGSSAILNSYFKFLSLVPLRDQLPLVVAQLFVLREFFLLLLSAFYPVPSLVPGGCCR